MFDRKPAALLRSGGAITALVIAILLPTLVSDPTWRSIAVQTLIMACGALGLTLLFGFAGQISLAQGAFMGMGAFAPAILAIKYGISPWWGLPVGIAVASVVAVVVGAPVLRLEGLYLAMATTALNILIVIVASQWTSITGGPYGLAGLHPLTLFGWDLVNVSTFYYVVLGAFVVLYILAYRLVNSPVGVMLAAVRHDSRAAGLAGVPVSILKIKIFTLSAAYAAIGGFFLAEYLLLASPEQYGIVPSLYFLLMVVIGGTRSLIGALVGAAFVTAVPQLFPNMPSEQQILFAVSYLVIVVLFPEGLTGLAVSLWHRIRRSAARPPAKPNPDSGPA